MKKLFLIIPFLAGCMSTAPDGTKTHNLLSRVNPMNWGRAGEVVAKASPFAPYHFGAIGMFIAGVVCIAWARGNSRTGFSLIIGGGVLSAWATLVPRLAPFITWAVIIGAVSGLVYLAYLLFKREQSRGDS